MIIGFTGHDIVWNNKNKRITISLTYKIISFIINENYIVVLEEWEYLDNSENLHIYDLQGNFLFNIKSAPKALHNQGFYSSVGFEDENILIAQSNDYCYKINLLTREFIDEKYTK